MTPSLARPVLRLPSTAVVTARSDLVDGHCRDPIARGLTAPCTGASPSIGAVGGPVRGGAHFGQAAADVFSLSAGRTCRDRLGVGLLSSGALPVTAEQLGANSRHPAMPGHPI